LLQSFSIPEKKGVTPIIRSVDKGTGKGLFSQIINALVSDNYYLFTDDPQRDICGEFNELLSHKLIIVMDESEQSVTKKNMEKLKSKITETKQTINAKNKNKDSKTRSFSNYIMLTNRRIQWEHNCRRPLFLEMNGRLKGVRVHSDAVGKSIEDPTFIRYMFDFFKSRGISELDLENDRPVTEAHIQMEARSVPIEIQFLIEWGICKRFFYDSSGKPLKPFKVKASDLHEQYRTFIQDYKEFHPLSLPAFGNRLRELKSDGMVGWNKKHTDKGEQYWIDVEEFKKWIISQNYHIDDGDITDSMTNAAVGYFPDTRQMIYKAGKVEDDIEMR
jgi:hypothetical protein